MDHLGGSTEACNECDRHDMPTAAHALKQSYAGVYYSTEINQLKMTL